MILLQALDLLIIQVFYQRILDDKDNLDIYIKNLKSIQSKISLTPKNIFTASSLIRMKWT